MSQSRQDVRSVLIGTILGDSYITNRGEFCCEQVTKDLIDVKKKILSTIAPDIRIHYLCRAPRTAITENRMIIGRKAIHKIYSNQHKYFKKLRNIFYTKENKKIVPMSVLKKLTPIGIAMWIMDDGYMDYKESSATRNFRICTDSFDEQSIRNIITYFNNTYNIQTKILYHKRSKDATPNPRISFNAFNTQKLIALIYKHMLPSFYYKLDMHYKQRTLDSISCSPEYIEARNYMLQQSALLINSEEIV